MLYHHPKCLICWPLCNIGYVTLNLLSSRANIGHLEVFLFKKYGGHCLCYREGYCIFLFLYAYCFLNHHLVIHKY
jgi:hypothetical protein